MFKNRKAENTSLFGWLTPGAVIKSIFGNPEDSSTLRAEYDALREQLEMHIQEKSKLQEQHYEEIGKLNNTISFLHEELETKLKEMALLTQRYGKRKIKYFATRKKLEELDLKAKKLENNLEEVLKAVAIKENKMEEQEKKHQEQLKQMKERIVKWLEIEQMKFTPEKVLEIIKKSESDQSEFLVFQETGSIEEDICKLQSILIVKLKTYKAYAKKTLNGEAKAEKNEYHNNSDKEDSEPLKESKAQRKRSLSVDFGYTADFKDIEKMVKSIECPFKKQMQISEILLEENKAKVAILEKKEKLLEKVMSSTVLNVYINFCSLNVQVVISCLYSPSVLELKTHNEIS